MPLSLENPSISVVIPSYHGQDLLERHLPSLLHAVESSDQSCEIIVVDDGWSDNSRRVCISLSSTIRYLGYKDNMGFSTATNFGVLHAKGSIVVLLNNDMDLDSNMFDYIMSAFLDPQLFGLRFAIRAFPSEPIRTPELIRYYPFISRGFLENRCLIVDRSTAEKFPFTFSISGGASAIDRIKFLALGGFDERFNPYYWEDIDLSLRAWYAGYTIKYQPNSIVLHHTHSTIKNQPDKEVRRIAERNRYLLFWKHLLNGETRNKHIAWSLLRSFGTPLPGHHHHFPSLVEAIKSCPPMKSSEGGRERYPLTFEDIQLFFKPIEPFLTNQMI